MSQQKNIAERVISAVSASGQETKVLVRVGAPYEISEDEWACPVGLDGLHDNLHDQHGIDSWQALQLALQLISQLLSYFVEEGGRLYWPEIGEEISVGDLMPLIKAKA